MSGERLQDHWSSGYYMLGGNLGSLLYGDVSVMFIRLMNVLTFQHLYTGYICYSAELNIKQFYNLGTSSCENGHHCNLDF